MATAKNSGGRPAHAPTDKDRKQVEALAGLGLPHEQIGAIIGIDDKTLRKHYPKELEVGKAKASAKVSKSLFDKALGGDTTACIWWTKTQMGWKEKVALEHTGENGGPVLTAQLSEKRFEEIAKKVASEI